MLLDAARTKIIQIRDQTFIFVHAIYYDLHIFSDPQLFSSTVFEYLGLLVNLCFMKQALSIPTPQEEPFDIMSVIIIWDK